MRIIAWLLTLDRSVGERGMSALDNAYIFQIRDKLRETPVAASHAVAVIRTLFRFALARGIVTVDPTVNIGKLKGGNGFERWRAADADAFRAAAVPMMRLALELGLYTGQRLSDVIRPAWSNYDGQRFRLRQ